MQPTVSIVIATYNMGHLIRDTIRSCLEQDYPKIEIVVYDDCSTDDTEKILSDSAGIRYYRGTKNKGVGNAFNTGIGLAKGGIVVIMCADDLFLEKKYISDVVKEFNQNYKVGYVTRYYYQFVDSYRRPVRAWRGIDPIVLANNPSGLAFRRKALRGLKCSNKMFIETSSLACEVLRNKWAHKIIPYDAIGARVHESTSTQPGYWLKRRVSSPVQDWYDIDCPAMTRDYVSLIQIKNGFKISAVFEEIWNFIKLRPINLLIPTFWFWSLVAILIPRRILRKLPPFYRKHIGSKTVKRIRR